MPRDPLLRDYLASLDQINGLRVSQSGRVWSIRYKTTKIWQQEVAKLVKVVRGNVLVVDCGFQLSHLKDDRVHVIEWEEEGDFRANSDDIITVSIYSNFNLLALEDRVKSQQLKRIEKGYETIIVSNLDFS